ncbi:hypothetical protein [Streptomyces sp. NBC_00984]|uniref:hypothetical protein n=1 Tax=Streptomyces sp. NBC_00984 TaxID=2903700 RepID=UPI0038634C02
MLATGLVSALGLVAVAVVDRPHRAIALWLLIVSAAFLIALSSTNRSVRRGNICA